MTNTFTAEHRATLENYLNTHELPSGLGNEESACSIAAINLAISGELTDDIPDCMSKVLGKATISLQDKMPDEMRNSVRYKRLLPDMAGTGREQEKERLEILIKWVWETVLPQLQPIADTHGFSSEWQKMCSEKTHAAAAAAAAAADATAAAAADVDADYAAAYAAAHAAASARATVRAADADAAAYAAAAAAHAASAAAADADAAYAAAYAARDAAARAAAYAADKFWGKVEPVGVLEKMTYLKGRNDE